METLWLFGFCGIVFLQSQLLLALDLTISLDQDWPVKEDGTSKRHTCVKDCANQRDGNYQSCSSCKMFVTCAHGRLYNMPCAANLKWDDNVKRCVQNSSTCKRSYGTESVSNDEDEWLRTLDSDVSRRKCVKDCTHKKDGKYKSCTGCHYFTQCTKGQITQVACPDKLEWDNRAKRCVEKSTTCKRFDDDGKLGTCPTIQGPCVKMCSTDSDCPGPFKCCPVSNGCGQMCVPPVSEQSGPVELNYFDDPVVQLDANMEQIRMTHTPKRKRCKSTGPRCVSDCTGKKDGDYQSCRGCDVYVSCVAGLRYDERPCAPNGLVWDDNKKRCEYNSSTCDGCSYPKPCKGTGPCCVTSCKGLPDGNYQSCLGCSVFVTCSSGKIYDKRPCAPKGTVWDDNKKVCDWYSNTCHHCRGN